MIMEVRKVDNTTVVCECFKVTVSDIKKAIENGARSFEEVQEVTKVGTGCGNCNNSIKQLVTQLLVN